MVELLEDFYFGDELIEVADVGFSDFLDCAVGVFLGEELGLVDGAVCAFAQFLYSDMKYLLELVKFLDCLAVGVTEEGLFDEKTAVDHLGFTELLNLIDLILARIK